MINRSNPGAPTFSPALAPPQGQGVPRSSSVGTQESEALARLEGEGGRVLDEEPRHPVTTRTVAALRSGTAVGAGPIEVAKRPRVPTRPWKPAQGGPP